ncbi:MAG: hypothetical protein LT071_09115 [Nocardioides sp.]|nr:hypothetical protein [Nocardioides sp.]
MPSDYRLAPAVAARLLGGVLIGIAVMVFVATGLVIVLDLHSVVLVIPLVIGLLAFVAAAVLHQRRGWVVRLSEEGYKVQWVRGVGTDAARWTDVEDAVTDTVAGAPVVVLRLRDGRTTTIPVQMLAVDREQFVRDIQAHLQRGHGIRKL